MSEYTKPVCRGSWSLGTACGKCERCLATRPQPSAEPVAYLYEHEGGIARRLEFALLAPEDGWAEEALVRASALEAARREDQARIAALEADKARLMGLVKAVGADMNSMADLVAIYARQPNEPTRKRDKLAQAHWDQLVKAVGQILRATLAKIKGATDAE